MALKSSAISMLYAVTQSYPAPLSLLGYLPECQRGPARQIRNEARFIKAFRPDYLPGRQHEHPHHRDYMLRPK